MIIALSVGNWGCNVIWQHMAGQMMISSKLINKTVITQTNKVQDFSCIAK